jgi:hypothetical protein
MLLRGLSTHYWNCQSNRQFYIINIWSSWHNICLFTLNQILNLFQGLWTVYQHLSKRKVVGKSMNIIWNYNMQSALWLIDLSDF